MWRRLRGGQRKRRGGTTGKASTPPPSSAPGISMAMGVPISTPASVRSDLEDAATATDNLTEAVVAQEPSPVQLQLPPTDPDREEMNRRLSLDGELPASARRPDQTESSTGTSAGVVSVAHEHLAYRIDVAGCSKAGWEPARAPPGGAPLEQLEVRKENQDAFCIFAPFVGGARSLSSPPPEMDVADIACHNLNSTGATTTAAHQDCKDSQMFLGVFDGHGAEGRAIAHFVRDGVARMTKETAARTGAEGPPPHAGNGGTSVSRETHRARMETLKSAFSRAERGLTDENNKIDHLFSGTTAVVTWLFNNDVYTAWAGDSRCIVGRAVEADDGRTKFKPVDLSHDQKPNRVDEKKRVKNAGGRIARWKRNIGPLRVWLPRDWIPGLAMTRSIGDTVLSEYGVSPVPEVTYTRLCNTDTFMVLASDGVWEFMTSENVADFVGRMLAEGSTAAETSEALVREAVRRWRRNEMVVDDTTAVVMHFHPRQGAGMAHADAPCAKGETLQDAMPSRKDHSSGMEKANIGKKLFGMGRTPFPKRTAWNGTVLLVNDDGRLTDFVCKNDVANGA